MIRNTTNPYTAPILPIYGKVQRRGSPWSPYALGTSVVVWFDASVVSSLSISSNLVSSWHSIVGNISATQSTYKPTWATNQQNGHGGLVFNGSTTYLGFNSMSGMPTGTANSCFYIVASSNYSGSTSMKPFSYGGVGTNGDARDVAQRNSGAIVSSGNNGSDLITAASWGNKILIVGSDLYNSGATCNLYINGSTYTGPLSQTNVQSTYGTIGAAASGSGEYWSGNIYEIIVFNRLLTLTERQSLEGYMAAKWGLQNTLGSTHPFNVYIPFKF